MRAFAIGAGGNDRLLCRLLRRFDHPFIGIEGVVCYHDVGVDGGRQQIGAVEIIGIAGSESEVGWIAERIDGGIDFSGQPWSARLRHARSLRCPPCGAGPSLGRSER
jgi:hypothetical protein